MCVCTFLAVLEDVISFLGIQEALSCCSSSGDDFLIVLLQVGSCLLWQGGGVGHLWSPLGPIKFCSLWESRVVTVPQKGSQERDQMFMFFNGRIHYFYLFFYVFSPSLQVSGECLFVAVFLSVSVYCILFPNEDNVAHSLTGHI